MNRNHLLIANIFKLRKYQTFGLMKIITWGKSDLPIINSVRLRLTGRFNFWIFSFSKFQMTIFKNLTTGFEGFLKILLRHKFFWSQHFWQWNSGPFKNFWNFHGNAFCFFSFSKRKKHYNLPFDDTFKMYCCALC